MSTPWSWLGIRSSRRVDGHTFRAISREPVARALSPVGSGRKDYRVAFPDASRMTITLTRDRPFADLVPSPLAPVYAAALSPITPGMRIAALRVLTGDVGPMISARVGPSGSAVALDPDGEAIRFARRRYPLANLSFETGAMAALEHEPPESFDAFLGIGALRPGDDPASMVNAAGNLVRSGGWIILAQPVRTSPVPSIAPVPVEALARALGRVADEPETTRAEDWVIVAALARGAVRSPA